MKNSLPVWLKGIGLIGGSMCVAYQQGISQWANEGTWPSGINWHMIWVGTLGAGFVALVTFCSGSFTNWHADRKSSGNGDSAPPLPTTPPGP